MARAEIRQYRIEVAAPYLMNRIVNRLNRRLADDLGAVGLTFRHWRVLAFLATNRQRTIADLAEYTVTPHSTLSRFLDRMAGAGLVQRSGAADDQRAVLLSLAPKGRRLYEGILPLALDINRLLLRGFSDRDRQALGRLLARMRDNVGLDARPTDRAASRRAAGRGKLARTGKTPRAKRTLRSRAWKSPSTTKSKI
jgi:DNA-binding MarR family transcriptional regulator